MMVYKNPPLEASKPWAVAIAAPDIARLMTLARRDDSVPPPGVLTSYQRCARAFGSLAVGKAGLARLDWHDPDSCASTPALGHKGTAIPWAATEAQANVVFTLRESWSVLDGEVACFAVPGVAMASSRPPPIIRGRNLVVRRVGPLMVMVQNKETPSDGEWDEFLSLLVEHRAELPKLKLLVTTAGGGPSATQRKRLENALQGTPMRVAVISDNMKVRFVASMIALFHVDHRSFLTTELEEAYDHLQLTSIERRHVQAVVNELAPMVEGPGSVTAREAWPNKRGP